MAFSKPQTPREGYPSTPDVLYRLLSAANLQSSDKLEKAQWIEVEFNLIETDDPDYEGFHVVEHSDLDYIINQLDRADMYGEFIIGYVNYHV